MLTLKACPRCKGDVRLEDDYYGWYEQCIQCGYIHDLEAIDLVQRQNYQMDKRLEQVTGSGERQGKQKRLKVRAIKQSAKV